MRSGFDTSDPGAEHVAGFDIALGYLGGQTPHPWTGAQWDDQPERWRGPIWVLDPALDPVHQADLAVAAARAIGQPPLTLIFCDIETHQVPHLLAAFANRVHALDHLTSPYGSTSTLFSVEPRSGYWVADPTGSPHLYEHPHVIGTQWDQVTLPSGLVIDRSLFTDKAPLWDTRPPAGGDKPDWADAADAALRAAGTAVTAARQLLITHIQ